MSSQPTQFGVTLHIWPGQWDLPSFDPLCLAAVLYLQLAIPGHFSVVECSNPDLSPTGQLPFLVHDQYTVASYPLIVKYVSGLQNANLEGFREANLDTGFSPKETAQKTAWIAHAESHLGDLVYYYFYANQENWTKLTLPILASLFVIPQKYYVPRRIRDSYHERLLAAGLWKPFVEEKSVESPFPREVNPTETKPEETSKKSSLLHVFDIEKVLQKARSELDIYQSLLENKSFIIHNQLSSVDIIFAAHILLLTNPPYAELFLKNLVVDTYPTLYSHARTIFNNAFGQGKPQLRITSPSPSLWAVIPSLPSWSKKPTKKQPTPEDIKDTQIRWGFVGLALGTLVAYVAVVFPWDRFPSANHQHANNEDSDI